MSVTNPEFEAFQRALADGGFTERDFEIVHEEDPSPDVGIYATTGCVEITSRLNDKMRRYKAEPEAGWEDQFRQDLAAGVFGPPATV